MARALGCAAKLASDRPCASKRRRATVHQCNKPKFSSATQNASTTCGVKFKLPCPRSLEPPGDDTPLEPLDKKAIQKEAARKSSNKPAVSLNFDIRQALSRRCAADPVCIRDAGEELCSTTCAALCAKRRRSIPKQPMVSENATPESDEKVVQSREFVDVSVDCANLAESRVCPQKGGSGVESTSKEDSNGIAQTNKECFAPCNEAICKEPCGDLYPCKNPKCWKRKKKVTKCTDCAIQTLPPTRRRKKCYGMCEKSARQKREHAINVKTCRCTECQCYCCLDPSCQKDRPEQRRATPADANCRFIPKNKSCRGACSECSKKCKAMSSTRNACCNCPKCLCPKCKDPNIGKPGLPTPLDSIERVCNARCTKEKRKTDKEEIEQGVCPCFVLHEEESVKKPPIIFNCHACTCMPVVEETEPGPEEEAEVHVENLEVVVETPEVVVETAEVDQTSDKQETDLEVELVEAEVISEIEGSDKGETESEIEIHVETEIGFETESELEPEVPTPPPLPRVPSEPVYASIQESKLVSTEDLPDESCVCIYPIGTFPKNSGEGELSEKVGCRGPCTVTEICLCCNCAGKQNLMELCQTIGQCHKVQIGEKPDE